jgi:hypothetical protein
MNEREKALYQAARNVPVERLLKAGRHVMTSESAKHFKARNEALKARIAAADPVLEAMRTAIAKSSDFAPVRTALAAARKRPERLSLPPLFVPAAPKAARLKLGSVHMVDTPPFQAAVWQEISVFGGPNDISVPLPVADGTTGNMSFQIFGGGRDVAKQLFGQSFCSGWTDLRHSRWSAGDRRRRVPSFPRQPFIQLECGMAEPILAPCSRSRLDRTARRSVRSRGYFCRLACVHRDRFVLV